ncbi:MAG: hypothetical protein V7704_16105 [Aurantimonas endophytica]|uniref:Uncharacterized protein n=1 Tax=Aurantimonas endophytica TaxID=1522175 RepID=A0A7W6MPA2_9HYPH|nr:hypothetical protein [Aurantimonas endophytica]MBB4002657.1 hypothetical protein [Aurantimonas endophytica]MCO6403537.1 hypothetical protein [Aurantimonas endophytica]
MRFFRRLFGSLFLAFGTLLLAVGVVFAVGDIARSLAADALRLLPVGEALALLGIGVDPAATGSATVAVSYAAISGWSVAITAGALGVLFLLLGRGPRRVRRDALR